MKSWDRRLIQLTVQRTTNTAKFIQALHAANITMHHVRVDAQTMRFVLQRKYLPYVKKMRRQYGVKLRIQYETPSRILQNNMQTIGGVLLFLLMPIIFMQFIWRVDVQAPSIELADDITQYLQTEHKLRPPFHNKQLLSDFTLRQQLMQQFREFSWVHITKQGSHIVIKPQLAPINEVNEPLRPQYLIAGSSGVITHFDVRSGERKVFPNMTVYKGDTLVSGVVERGDEQFFVGAIGEVYADYWLESTFAIPQQIEFQTLVEQGWEVEWNWPVILQAINDQSWEPLKQIVKRQHYQQFTTVTEEISEEQIETFVLPLLHEKLLKSLPLKSIIKKENLLHITIEDGTVKGKVLFLVNENIATPYPNSRGE